MGSGVWSPTTYQRRASQRQATGQSAFHYSANAGAVHPTLNPYGLEVRESRDSDEHPDSNSIMVGLDVSGSMGAVVRAIHKDLPQLLNLLLNREYIPHPQIMFAAFSNGSCDPVAVQVGQFESDNRMDQHLENLILGGKLAGGCDVRESGELMFYVAARHTSFDAYEKRQRKGYLFVITDEMGYDNIKRDEIERVFGRKLDRDIPFKQMVDETREKYHTFVIIPQTKSGTDENVIRFWQSYVDPRHVIVLRNPDDVSETIALTIGINERNIRLEDGLNHLKQDGASSQTISALEDALAVLDEGAVKSAGSLSSLDSDDSGRGTRRL